MGEAYVFGIDNDPTTLCYTLTVEKIQLVPVGEGMMAHIHEGVRDENGPVVAALAGPEDGNAADCLTEGEMGKFPTGEPGIVARILANPANFYVNVHNPQYPKPDRRAPPDQLGTVGVAVGARDPRRDAVPGWRGQALMGALSGRALLRVGLDGSVWVLEDAPSGRLVRFVPGEG